MTWSMVRTWIFHGLITLAWGLLGFIAGLVTGGLMVAVLAGTIWSIACALGYFFREVRQHEWHDTSGLLEWLDRIMDVVSPVAVALGFTIWLGLMVWR